MNPSPQPHLQLTAYDPAPDLALGPLIDTSPTTPSEWFGSRFPLIQQRLGCAFLESVCVDESLHKTTIPVSLNEDFFAGMLGGDERLKHKTVFFTSEQTWYFYDPRIRMFARTTDEKLKLLASQLLVRCAQEMPRNVEIGRLFDEFRADDSLRGILKKAKALLAADESFFSPESKNTRVDGPETHERLARIFIRKAIRPEPMKMLTVRECFEMFCLFCKASGIVPVERRFFAPMVEDLVRELFSLNLRKDVLGANNRMQRGWKGLSVRLTDALSPERN